MRTWIKVSLLILLVFGICWGGAIWYWSETNRMPATEDLVLYLIVLPLGLLLAFWLGKKLIAAIAAAPAVAPAAQAGAAVPPPPPAAAPLALLAASIRTPHGAAVEALTEAIAENKARSDLDAELVDDAGFPVMTARSDDADDSGLKDEISAWFGENGRPEIELEDEQWRALALATAIAGDLASSAANELQPKQGLHPMLHLVPMLPADWQPEDRRAGGQWLRHVVSQSGWPIARIALAAEVPSDPRGSGPSAVLGRLAHQVTLSGEALVGLIVASASHIGETSINRWEGNATLFTAARPQGLIPGEGAAGLLVSDLRQAQALDGAAYALLHLEADARRHNSADESKKADAKLLGTMTEKVLVTGSAEAEKIGMLVADTGHRTSRVLELMELASTALPHLDADADLLRTGGACGTCGAVPFVTALALGRHHAIELEAPVLCISNEDPYRRSAVLVRPAAALS
jgi:hypothetical protein